jgi:glycosyltransferase involved in cell wall biosynthesis
MAAMAPRANAALFYHPEGVDASQPKLMGRHAAGEGFLVGFVRHAGVDTLHCSALTQAHFDDFRKRVTALRSPPPAMRWVRRGDAAALAEVGAITLPHPDLAPIAWQRRHGDQRGYSVTGVFHTTASDRIMAAIADFATAPLQAWDAAICTSRSVRATVERILAAWSEYLSERGGGRPRAHLQLPIIPLGVDCDAFAAGPAAAAMRARLRARLGIGAGEIVVLFVGRLSYHAKANPYPLMVGLERAAAKADHPVRLVFAGWFANEVLERNFREAGANLCRRVAVSFVDGREPETRFGVWTIADVFASLSDNVQETFGLTPIEAMAAGLPLVVSDWDGYRDTVRHGVDGFMVPTLMPPPGAGVDVALRYAHEIDTYDRYIGGASQSVAVDIAATAAALEALLADPGRRRAMGEAGRARARSEFDWRAIVARYQELWGELAARRTREAEIAPRRPGAPADPLRDDPYALFASYPSHTLAPSDVVRAIPGAALDEVAIAAPIAAYAAYLLPSEDELRALLARAAGGVTLAEVAGGMRGREAFAYRGVAWLAKMGLAEVIPGAIVSPAPEDTDRGSERRG